MNPVYYSGPRTLVPGFTAFDAGLFLSVFPPSNVKIMKMDKTQLVFFVNGKKVTADMNIQIISKFIVCLIICYTDLNL